MQRLQRYGYLFILPFFIVFAIFTAYPLLNTFWTSFTNDSANIIDAADIMFVGIQNYISELGEVLFWKSFVNTWLIWLPNIITQIGLAMLLAAWFTNYELNIRGKGIFRAIYFFPNLITVTTIAILVYVLFDWQSGAINQLFFGTSEAAKADKYVNWFMYGTRIQLILGGVQTWIWFGYTMITLIAGIQAMPRSYFEAALVDGASGARIFFSIVIPYIQPMLIFIMITSIIGGMQMFDMPWVLFNSQGGAEQGAMTMSVYMYSRAFVWDQDLGRGSAVAFILFALIAIFSFIYLKIVTRDNEGGAN